MSTRTAPAIVVLAAEPPEEEWYVLLHRTTLAVLSALVFVFATLAMLPSLVQSQSAVNFMTAVLAAPQMLLAGVLATQAVGRAWPNLVKGHERYVLAQRGTDVLAVAVAAIAALLAAFSPLLNTALGLSQCAGARGNSTQVLEWMLDTVGCGNITLGNATTLMRRPHFATELTWRQLCLDDQLMAWLFIANCAVLIVLDVVVLVVEQRARAETERLEHRGKRA